MKTLAVAIGAYLLVVFLFELMVVVLGIRQARSGKPPESPFIAIEVDDESGKRDVIVAGVEVDGALYASANHWPRS